MINRQWVSLEWEHRSHLKTALHSYLIKNNATCPNFLRNKIAKLFVDIARHDWPHFYPEYVTNILQVSLNHITDLNIKIQYCFPELYFLS